MKTIYLILCLFFYSLPLQAQPTELVLWHGMAGSLGDALNTLVEDFNHSQHEFTVKAVYKGNYLETLTSFVAAFRAHQAPAMVQVFEVGTAIMLTPKGVIKPLDSLMREQGISVPKEDFIPSVRAFYSRDGALMAMPFNLSAPALYYNKTLLAKLGYSAANFPQSWDEMEVLAKKVKAAGYDCVYTTAYPGWILVESYLAIHGLPMTEGDPVRAVFDRPEVLHHFERLKQWQNKHYFRYGGRVDDATIFFTSGVCPLFSQSSGAYQSLAELVPFSLGVAMMPLDKKVSSLRHANVSGGAALWATAGQDATHYKGIAEFFAFIARPQVQSKWQKNTGYLPLGFTGIYAAMTEASHHPALLMARKDLTSDVGPSFKFLGPQNQIRGVNDEALEAMFAGLITPKEALALAVKRSNHVLDRFFNNNGQP